MEEVLESLWVRGGRFVADARNHREIVAAAWTDFGAGLPDRYAPMLSALEDGRETVLKYPNLLRSDSGEIIPHAEESSFLEVS